MRTSLTAADYTQHSDSATNMRACSAAQLWPPGSPDHGIFQVRVLEWSSLPTPEDRPKPVIKPTSLASLTSPAWAGGFFTTAPSEKPKNHQ